MACIIISVVKPTWLAEFKFINFLKVVIDKWGKLRALKRLKRRQTQLGGRAFKLALKYCHLAVDLVTVYRVMLLLSPAFPSSMKSKSTMEHTAEIGNSGIRLLSAAGVSTTWMVNRWWFTMESRGPISYSCAHLGYHLTRPIDLSMTPGPFRNSGGW